VWAGVYLNTLPDSPKTSLNPSPRTLKVSGIVKSLTMKICLLLIYILTLAVADQGGGHGPQSQHLDLPQYFGVIISNDLHLNLHVNCISSRAKRVLNLPRWNIYGCTADINVQATLHSSILTLSLLQLLGIYTLLPALTKLKKCKEELLD
jgi:hypothetical protein